MAKTENLFLPNIAERITKLTDELGSQDQAAEFLGVSQSSLSRARRGQNDPSGFLLRQIAEKMNVSLDYILCISDDRAPPLKLGSKALRAIPRLDLRAAAGAGSCANVAAVEEQLAFPLWMLQKLAGPNDKLSLLRAAGDSMAPTISDGALLLVNETDAILPEKPPRRRNEYDHRDVYVFLQGGDLRVKRLVAAPKGVFVMSDNPAYGPELLDGSDLRQFKIIGRVIWWDNRL